jgi:hypothetical protein
MNTLEYIGHSPKSCREEVSYHSPKLISERMKEEKYVEEGRRKE